MMKKQWTNLALAGSMALTLMLAGCGATGNQINPNDPYGTGNGYGYDDPYSGGGSYGNDYGSDYGGSTGGSYNNGGYGNTTGGYNNGTANNGGYVPAELTLGPLDKKKSGVLLWKKMTVSGQVKNNTQQTLSGELQISFTKNGKVVEAQTEFVADLTPGQAHSFSLKSKKACDDVQVSVIAQVAAPIGGGNYNNGGYGNTTGGYNNGGYGNTTGGYNNGGYGNTTGGYGSGTGYNY